MTIGEKIKHYRKELGYTQTELGEKLGVMKNAVSKWETGRVTAIPTQKLFALADMFHISLSELIDDENIILRQNPDAKRAAALYFLKELGIYVSPSYDWAEETLSDLFDNSADNHPPRHVWTVHNAMTNETYELSEEHVNETADLIARYSQILFGPNEQGDFFTILRGVLQLTPEARSMLSAQIKIFVEK